MTINTENGMNETSHENKGQYGYAKLLFTMALVLLLLGLGASYQWLSQEKGGVMAVSCLLTSLFIFYHANEYRIRNKK